MDFFLKRKLFSFISTKNLYFLIQNSFSKKIIWIFIYLHIYNPVKWEKNLSTKG